MAAAPSFDAIEVEKPATDYRTYRTAKLANNLRVLLVSDEKCDKAAAALSVETGSILDPAEIPGLAHFCEHMLFLGTEKYPREDEYNEHLQKNGGASNAYTAETVTNYFFGVRPEALESSLDRFAQFFTAPLFTESATERELKAVDSEHSKNLQEDAWRSSQMLRNSANPKHPLNHFMTGNSETLKGEGVRKALLEFHERYYSANLMKLVIVGRESPDELLSMAQEKFSAVVDRDAKVVRGEELGGGIEPFSSEQLGRIVHVVPVNDMRSVNFQFMLPGQQKLWRSKPAHYLSHLIGHEGKGSLLAALKRRGLATELTAGAALDEAGVHVFSVGVLVTEAGEADLGAVGDLVFAYIRLLREAGPDEQLWRELQVLSDLGFKFRSLSNSVSTASGLAHSLQVYDPEVALSASSRLWEYDPDMIRELMGLLTCDKMRLVLTSKTHAAICDSEEAWYGTKYSDKPLGPELRSRWEKAAGFDDLAPPAPNPFVPEDLAIKPAMQGEQPTWPTQLRLDAKEHSAGGKSIVTGYFRKDEQFKLPKAVCAFILYSPFSVGNVNNRMLSELWCSTVKEELNEFAYEATCAGVSYSLAATSSGMHLSFGGYNDKLPTLLSAVTTKLAGLTEVPEQAYNITKAIMERNLTNATERSTPYQQAMMHTSCLMQSPANTFKERLKALQAIGSREALTGINKKLVERCHVECLLQGNLTDAEAQGLVSSFLGPLGAQQPLEELPETAVAQLPPGWTLLLREGTNPEERNGAVVVTLQAAEYTLEGKCLVDLASQVLSQRFFDELRTKQQLGYIVQASAYSEEHGFVGMRFLIQSERPPAYVLGRVRAWMKDAWEYLETGLTEEQLEEYRTALIAQLKERPKSLNEEFSRNWVEVASRGLRWNRRLAEAEDLQRITLADVQRFATEKLKAAPAVCALVQPQTRPPAEGSGDAAATAPAEADAADGGEPQVDRSWGDDDIAAFRRDAKWRARNKAIRRGGAGTTEAESRL